MPPSNPMTDAELEKLVREVARQICTRAMMRDVDHWCSGLILAALKSVRDTSTTCTLCDKEELFRNEPDGMRKHASYWHDADCSIECSLWRDNEIAHLEQENTDLRAHFSQTNPFGIKA